MSERQNPTNETWPRSAVIQYTNAELRKVVRHQWSLGLMTPRQAKQYRMMAYGVLLERQRKAASGDRT